MSEVASHASRHLRLWLARNELTYGPSARERFVRSHPDLFGSAYEVTLRGYERWRMRRGAVDTVETLAEYIGPRHQRWLGGTASLFEIPPCVIGRDGRPACPARDKSHPTVQTL